LETVAAGQPGDLNIDVANLEKGRQGLDPVTLPVVTNTCKELGDGDDRDGWGAAKRRTR
jgi:hypothetical protein